MACLEQKPANVIEWKMGSNFLCEHLKFSGSSLGNSGRKTVTARGLNENKRTHL